MRRLLFAIGMLTLCTACVKDDIDEDKILLTETAYNWDTSDASRIYK